MNIFQRYLAEEFAEDYQEQRISRREALRLIVGVTGSVVVANSILAACTPREVGSGTQPAGATSIPNTGQTAQPTAPTERSLAAPTEGSLAAPTEGSLATPTAAETVTSTATQAASETPTAGATGATPASSPAAYGTVSPDDPQVVASDIEFPGTDASVKGYLARPAGNGSFPVILVCHENRGLTPHIQDVTRRLAKAGYVALAVDLLSRKGGTAALASGDVPGVLGNTSPDQFAADFRSGWTYLGQQSFAQAAKVGMMGVCFCGGVTWLMTTRMPELRAAVPFYGPHPDLNDVPKIQAAVLGIYGELDQRIDAGIPEIEAAMQQNHKTFEKRIYPGADHAFFNDTGTRYNPDAARDAWSRALAWFEKYV